MKIAFCDTLLEKMILPQDREYIGVDHGVEELLKQGITPSLPSVILIPYKIDRH